MTYDLVIRNGTVVDGSGAAALSRPTSASRDGRDRRASAASASAAREEIDAEGHGRRARASSTATPTWTPRSSGTRSAPARAGTASPRVVMGNCGFTLAPCRRRRAPPGRAQPRARRGHLAARPWRPASTGRWETFPEYLDALEPLPKGINYAGYIGHSALRTWAMGERAFERGGDRGRPARRWSASCATRCAAGAIGFTTSRTPQPRDVRRPAGGQPRWPTWDEVRALVGVMGDLGAGIFEIAGEDAAATPRPGAREYHERLRDLAVETGVPDHLRPVQPRATPGRLARLPRPARRDGGGGRPHVRPGPQPRRSRAAVVRDPAAVRRAAGVDASCAQLPLAEQTQRAARPRRCAGALVEAAARARDYGRARRRRGRQAGLRLDLRAGRPVQARTATVAEVARGARRRPGRGDDRPGARDATSSSSSCSRSPTRTRTTCWR